MFRLTHESVVPVNATASVLRPLVTSTLSSNFDSTSVVPYSYLEGVIRYVPRFGRFDYRFELLRVQKYVHWVHVLQNQSKGSSSVTYVDISSDQQWFDVERTTAVRTELTVSEPRAVNTQTTIRNVL